VVGQVLDAVGPEPDVAMVFVTGGHLGQIDEVVDAVRAMLAPGLLVGSSAVSIIGNAREVEERPAISLWAGRIDGVVPVRMEAQRSTGGWAIGGFPTDVTGGTLVLITDPFSFPLDGLLPQLHERVPDLAVIGGLASASAVPGGNRLVLDGAIHAGGAVGMIVPPGTIEPVVSQGCRPVGDPFIVTAVDRNVVLELGGRPAADRLRELVAGLDEETRALAARGLHAGIVVDERLVEFRRGDFLIRGVMGLDPERDGVVIGAPLQLGQTMQFQVRDARTASEDLRSLLQGRNAAGALLFTCNGRGSHLFDEPDHDAAAAHELLGAPALAGMFCAGEIGPVGTENHLHGFTASLALFT
jgi:small ligand-binding sensory domain FIST